MTAKFKLFTFRQRDDFTGRKLMASSPLCGSNERKTNLRYLLSLP